VKKAIALLVAPLVALAIVGITAPVPALASEPFLMIVQYPEYPLPGQPFRYPGGLVFAACSDGVVLRAKGLSDVGSNLYAASLTMPQFEELKGVLSPTLLDALRRDCSWLPLHAPSHRITVHVGDEIETFQCYVGVESKAVDALNATIWKTPLSNARFVGQRPEPTCP
jgi:hypothetical protein